MKVEHTSEEPQGLDPSHILVCKCLGNLTFGSDKLNYIGAFVAAWKRRAHGFGCDMPADVFSIQADVGVEKKTAAAPSEPSCELIMWQRPLGELKYRDT